MWCLKAAHTFIKSDNASCLVTTQFPVFLAPLDRSYKAVLVVLRLAAIGSGRAQLLASSADERPCVLVASGRLIGLL
ncbi:hypothetical protein QE368_002180 [Asaia bogorensis NBRC 16594]|nr:hypothetical protein [Asaia bogorensis NBRC 16594]